MMRLYSDAFAADAMIPPEYTCDGENISPPLRWEGAPEAAESLALICDDPDAPGGVWSHWVLYDLPTDQDRMPEGFSPDEHGWRGVAGRNDFGENGYGGPCPPAGPPHRYYFRLYALDTLLDFSPGATRDQVLEAMEGHVLENTEFMGRYGRS
jgi:hypothetical protein